MLDASDDESGHTESLASTDHTPDDVSSLADDEDFDVHNDNDNDDSNNQAYTLGMHESETHTHHAPSTEASMLTSMADTQGSEESYIQLEEEKCSDGSFDAGGTVTKFEQDRGLPRVLQGYGCAEIKHTVRMRLSERHLPVPRSYRLLYIGEFPEWGVKEVNAQIAAALDATPSSSRFNIVQGPAYPGGPSSSNVQLERSGPELVVDHCKTPHILQESNTSARVQVTLDDETQLIFGPGASLQVKGESSGVRLPDLVIFCHYTMQSESNSDSEIQKFRLAREAFQRNDIPILDIATTRPYGKCPPGFSYNESGLRLCVEGRNPHQEKYEVQETLPIDIYAFSSVDPSQLNRHLSFISPRTSRSELSPTKKEDGWWTVNRLSSSNTNLRQLWNQPRLWLPLLALSAMVTVYLSGLSPPSLFYQSTQSHVPQQLATTAPDSYTAAVPAVLEPVVPVSSQEPPRVSQIPRDVSIVRPQETPKKNQADRAASEKPEPASLGFSAETVDEYQFTLRRIQNSSSIRKRKPTVKINVTLDSQPVPIKVSQTPNGDYTVELIGDYPASIFRVEVLQSIRSFGVLSWTCTKFDINLGHSRSRLQELIEFVRHDVAVVQNNLKNITTSVQKRIHSGVSHFEDRKVAAVHQTRRWKKHIQDSTQSVAEHLQDATKEASRQVRIGTETTKEVSKALWHNYKDLATRYKSYTQGMMRTVQDINPNLWERSAPVRKSKPLRRARKNALAIRKKILSSRSTVSQKQKEQKPCKGKSFWQKKRGSAGNVVG